MAATATNKQLRDSPADFALQSIKNHIQHCFLPHFVFVQDRQAMAHREALVQVFGIASGEDDDATFVDALFYCVGKQFTTIKSRHLQVEEQQIEVGIDLAQGFGRVLVGDDIQLGIALSHIIAQEFEEKTVIINEQDLFHGLFPTFSCLVLSLYQVSLEMVTDGNPFPSLEFKLS